MFIAMEHGTHPPSGRSCVLDELNPSDRNTTLPSWRRAGPTRSMLYKHYPPGGGRAVARCWLIHITSCGSRPDMDANRTFSHRLLRGWASSRRAAFAGTTLNQRPLGDCKGTEYIGAATESEYPIPGFRYGSVTIVQSSKA